MAKKYLLHRITEEDADYIAEETYTSRDRINGGDCYLLVNKNSGKVFRENGSVLIYKATGVQRYFPVVVESISGEKKRFLEAIEACAYFRGYANTHEIGFKTSKIVELLYELEDHAIEIPEECDTCTIVTIEGAPLNREVLEYMTQAVEGFDVLSGLQRNLPTLALFINEAVPERVPMEVPEEENDFEEDFDFEEV